MPSVRFPPTDRQARVVRGTRLIDAVRGAGLPIASACGDELICGKCGVRILSGRVARESRTERDARQRNRVPDGVRLACALRVQADLVVTADYWGGKR